MKFKTYRKIWFVIIKYSIVFGAAYYVYKHAFSNSKISAQVFFKQISNHLFEDYTLLSFILLMSVFNWWLESYKWQLLVSSIKKISFLEAAKQSLGSHTLSMITPFKSGEYLGKAVYYTGRLRGKVVFLNFIGNMAQLSISLLFGILGLWFFVKNYPVKIHFYKIRRILYLLVFVLMAFIGGNKRYAHKKNTFYSKAIGFYKRLRTEIKIKVLILSLLRYILFSHQFYLLLVIFNIQIPYETAMLLIFAMYILATFIPVFSLFDFVIKGSIALYLFSFTGADALQVIVVSTLMWFLNFVLPAFVGSYFVITFNNNKIR